MSTPDMAYRLLTFMILLTLPSCQDIPVRPVETVAGSLPRFNVPWTEGQSVVCFGTSLTYGYGAGERSPYCKEVSTPIGRRTYVEYATAEIIRLTGEHEEKVLELRRRTMAAGGECEGDSSYPAFLQTGIRLPVHNQGYVAATSSVGLDLVEDSVLAKNPALVFLEFGANDFLRRYPVSVADTALSQLVRKLRDSGVAVVFVSFIHPDMAKYTDGTFWDQEDSLRALAYHTMITDVVDRYSLPLIGYPLEGVFGQPGLMSDRFHPNGEGYRKMATNIATAMLETFRENGMLVQ